MKRYDLLPNYYGDDRLEEDPDGEWIRYTDHAEAMKRIAGDSAQAEPVAWLHEMFEPTGQHLTLYSASSDNPWSHWLGTYREQCRYQATPLYAAPSPIACDGKTYGTEKHTVPTGWKLVPEAFIDKFKASTRATNPRAAMILSDEANDILDSATPSATSADDVRDAARYRWLAERFTGYDFNWMPSEEGALDGKSCIVIEATEGFRGGRDLGAGIDAAMSATPPAAE